MKMYIVVVSILLIMAVIGFIMRKLQYQKQIKLAQAAAQELLQNNNQKTSQLLKEQTEAANTEIAQYQKQVQSELDEDERDNQKKANWIEQRLESIQQKTNLIKHRQDGVNDRIDQVNNQKKTLQTTRKQAADLKKERKALMYKVAELTPEAAKKIILDTTTEEVKQTYDEYVQNAMTELQSSDELEAENLIEFAMEHIADHTELFENNRTLEVSSKEYLGKIIGNAGQNVRALEALLGIDIVVDDKAKIITLNGYDPVRRAIAIIVLKAIKGEHRVNPDVIEKLVNEANQTIDQQIRQIGEKTVQDLGITKISPDLIKFIGRMYYRTSYGQNILEHSIETAKLAGVLAAELGEDSRMARRAGLLHDIGKSIDRDIDATHVEIGQELATRYREPAIVVNTIASHHGDVEADSVIADLVEAADAISGARQGARSESAADYLQRIKSIEAIANQQPQVSESYAIQAGRELRVIVKPQETTDKNIHALADTVKTRIEDEVTYPGQVKVTVVRKLEVVEYAEKRRA